MNLWSSGGQVCQINDANSNFEILQTFQENFSYLNTLQNCELSQSQQNK